VSTSFICGALPNNNSPHINREYQNCVFSCREICFPAQKIHHFGHVITGAHHNDPSISMVYCCMSMGQVAFDQALLYLQSYQLACILNGCHDGESSGADRVLEETVTHHTSCSKSSRHFPFIYSFSFIDKRADDAEHHF
jgi:hypothetical protein